MRTRPGLRPIFASARGRVAEESRLAESPGSPSAEFPAVGDNFRSPPSAAQSPERRSPGLAPQRSGALRQLVKCFKSWGWARCGWRGEVFFDRLLHEARARREPSWRTRKGGKNHRRRAAAGTARRTGPAPIALVKSGSMGPGPGRRTGRAQTQARQFGRRLGHHFDGRLTNDLWGWGAMPIADSLKRFLRRSCPSVTLMMNRVPGPEDRLQERIRFGLTKSQRSPDPAPATTSSVEGRRQRRRGAGTWSEVVGGFRRPVRNLLQRGASVAGPRGGAPRPPGPRQGDDLRLGPQHQLQRGVFGQEQA